MYHGIITELNIFSTPLCHCKGNLTRNVHRMLKMANKALFFSSLKQGKHTMKIFCFGVNV